MKNCLFIIMILVFFTLSSSIVWSLENRSIINPAGSSTVPASSIQSGFINNPNPIDTSGNLLITGNVRRGRHFRDSVPYQSTTSFSAGLGSSLLSSFLRDSVGVEDFGQYSGKYRTQPYYLRSRTVTTTTPGFPGVFRPTGTTINNRTSQNHLPAGMYGTGPEKQDLSDTGALVLDSGLQGRQTQYSTSGEPRRIVNSIRELQLLNQREDGIRRPRVQAQDSRGKRQETRFKTQETSIVLEPGPAVPGLEHKQSSVAEIFRPAEQNVAPDELVRAQANKAARDPALPIEPAGWEQGPQAEEAEPGEGDGNLQSGSDILERVRQQLADLVKSVNAEKHASAEGNAPDSYNKRETQLSKTVLSQTQQIKDARQDTTKVPGRQELSFNTTLFSTEQSIQPLDELKNLSQAELSARAKRIRGPYSSSESYSEAKFNQHFQAAQGHLKAGRYYAAADCFALASIYKRDDPLCFAGRGHSLFAAGEYISSALFLSRALELAPEYTRIKIDLAAMLGGQNRLESRLAEIKEWVGKRNSGKLEFLLGYVYYQMGRLEQAKQALETASKKMVQSSAVDAVKKAIDDAMAGQ